MKKKIIQIAFTIFPFSDIVITGSTKAELLQNLDACLGRLENAGFRVSLQKISIFRKNLKILGVILNETGLKPDPSKIECIRDLKPPTTKVEMQRILGMTNYQSEFIKNYSNLTTPLLKYVTGDVPKRFELNEQELEIFEKLKKACTADVQLNFIDSEKPIYMETDASFTGYSGWAYQCSTYTQDDLEELQEKHEKLQNKTQEEIDKELEEIITNYTGDKPIKTFDMSFPKVTEEHFKEHNPHLNIETKTRKTKDKVHVVQTNFFYSKKFAPEQIRTWNSLMKEIAAIVQVVEKKCDLLMIAERLLILTDCASTIFLYEQSNSNSIISRYLARLSSYTFQILIKHKAGKYLNVADGLSRIWTTEATMDQKGKVQHNQGVLVKTLFPPGKIVNPSDIIEAIATCSDTVVIASSSPTITKACQTEEIPETAVIITCKQENPDLTTTPNINNIDKAMQTGTRYGTPNRPPKRKIKTSPKTEILTIKKELHTQINEELSPMSYIEKQMEAFPDLYQSIVKGTADKKFQISEGLIMIKTNKNKHWVRYCPEPLRNFVILKHHYMGHYSYQKLIKIISFTDYWEGMAKDIKTWTDSCLSCLFLRGPKGKRQQLGIPLSSSATDIFQIDTVSGLPVVRGYQYFTSVIDTFSRFVVTLPLRQDRSAEITQNLITRVFPIIGSPRILISDGAKNMASSEKFQEMAAQYGIITKVRSPYSSRSLGTCERVHRSILEGIRSICDSYDTDWLSALSLSTAVYNAMPHNALGGYSPHEVFFGKESRIFHTENANINDLPQTPPGNYEEVVKNHKKQIKTIRKVVHKINKEYKERMRIRFGGTDKFFVEGQFVLAENKVPSTTERRKLKPRMYGPFLIHRVLDQTVWGENVLTGKTSYLHKDFLRPIPEKPHDRFANLPDIVKRKCGGGFTYDEWLQLLIDKKLPHLLNRSSKEKYAYGVEGPIEHYEHYVEDLGEDITEPEQVQAEKTTKDSSSSSSDDDNQLQPPFTSQPTVYVPDTTEHQENSRKQVRFNIPAESPNTSRAETRSGRHVKKPSRMDL